MWLCIGRTKAEGVQEQDAVEDNDMTQGWTKWHTGELHDFYMSQYIIQVNRSRRMRWEGHVALTKEKRNASSSSLGTTISVL
jgi:hypothetical protein